MSGQHFRMVETGGIEANGMVHTGAAGNVEISRPAGVTAAVA